MNLPTVACRACGRKIVWVRTVNNKAMPIDPDPYESGNVFVSIVKGNRVVRVASKDDPRPPGIAFRTHFETCPRADLNRKKSVSTVHPDPQPPANPHPAYVVPCAICAVDLDIRATGIHQWTSGWVKQRSGGGGHGISCPVRERRWAHEGCVEKAAAGQADQPDLFAT